MTCIKTPFTHYLIQTRLSASAVYTKRMEEENTRKEKDMQQRAKPDEEDHRYTEHTKKIGLKKDVTFGNSQNHHKRTGNTRRRVALIRMPLSRNKSESTRCHQNKDMGEITVLQGLLDVANSNMEATRKNLEACRNKK